jgi:tetratricopeptide (TPR) repeat protein
MTSRKSSSGRRIKKAAGSHTNVTGNIQGAALTGQFQAPVAPGGEAVDMSGSSSPMYKPTFVQQTDKFPPPRQIPAPPKDFLGRDDELKELLGLSERGVGIIGLRGLSGVGRKALACKLAELLKDRYPDGHLYVNMMGTRPSPLTPSKAMSQIIRSYYPDLRMSKSESEMANLYRSVLYSKRAILLLDNALDESQVRPLLPPANCLLIVIMRQKFVLPGMTVKDIGVMKLSKAVEFLIKATGMNLSAIPSQEIGIWEDLARLCGCLPLALRSAGSFLANASGTSPTHYAEELKEERTRLEKIGDQGAEIGVAANFNLSLQRLAIDTQQIFLNMSVFPADFDSQAEEFICQDEGHKRLSELVRWSLVDYQPQGSDYGRYKVHDLVRLFASSRQSAESRFIIQERHAAYFRDMLSAADDLYLKGGSNIQAGLALFNREWANIRAGQAWAESQMANGISRELDPAFQLCMDYANAGAYILDLRLHPEDKIGWLEAGLEAARTLKDRQAEVMHLSNLGLAYLALGYARKAIEYHEQALAIAREIGDKYGEGTSLGNLGMDYLSLGDAPKAIKYQEQALTISCKMGDRRGEGADLGNLGLAYAALRDAIRAIECYSLALAIYRDIGDRRGEGAVLGNMGIVERKLGDASKAVEYYKQSLTIAREIRDRLNEGAWLNDLGDVYADLGDAKTASEYHEHAIQIYREIGKRPDITGFRCKLKFSSRSKVHTLKE